MGFCFFIFFSLAGERGLVGRNAVGLSRGMTVNVS